MEAKAPSRSSDETMEEWARWYERWLASLAAAADRQRPSPRFV